jgi:hypothetical protein
MEKTMKFDTINPPISELAQRAAAKANLADGVHVLSQESQDIMKRIAERGAALEAGFTKRGS